MKKLFTMLTSLVLVFTLVACSNDTPTVTETNEMDTQESLVTLTYLSGGMLDTAGGSASNMMFMADKAEDDLDTINMYMDQLKVFIENGTKDFADVTEEVSDNPEYESKLTFVVKDEVYVLYYTINGSVIDGILIIEDVTYTIEGENDLKDNVKDESEMQAKLDELNAELAELEATVAEDEDEQEELDDEIADVKEEIAKLEEEISSEAIDEADEEQETKMKIVATNGDDSIEIEYKVEDKTDEMTTKFEIKSTINGEFTEKEMKIVSEEGHYKVEVEEGDDKLVFKRNEEDGEVVYKLEYTIDGEKGQVMIKESIDENGEVVYTYKFPGNKEVTRGRPESRGRDMDEDDEADDSNEV